MAIKFLIQASDNKISNTSFFEMQQQFKLFTF